MGPGPALSLWAAFIALMVLMGAAVVDAGSAPIPVGNLSTAMRVKLNTSRAAIMRWALVVDGAAAQDDCDTPGRGSCDCTFWNGILCSNPHARSDVSDIACTSRHRTDIGPRTAVCVRNECLMNHMAPCSPCSPCSV